MADQCGPQGRGRNEEGVIKALLHLEGVGF